MLLATLLVAGSSVIAGEPVNEAMLQRVASRMNKSLPQMESDNTRLDKITVGPGLTWTYNFTLVGLDDSHGTRKVIEANAPSIISKFCSLPATKIFLENNIITHMQYTDHAGKLVSDVLLDRAKCS